MARQVASARRLAFLLGESLAFGGIPPEFSSGAKGHRLSSKVKEMLLKLRDGRIDGVKAGEMKQFINRVFPSKTRERRIAHRFARRAFGPVSKALPERYNNRRGMHRGTI
jgi:hypothetical protein